MYNAIFLVTSCLFSIYATVITYISLPADYPYKMLLLAILILLSIGYLVAFFLWIGKQIKIDMVWNVLRTCKIKGIDKLFEDGKLGPVRCTAPIESSRTIRIISTTGHSIYRNQKQAFIKALKDPDAKVLVLLGDPDSIFISEVEAMEGPDRENHIREEGASTIDLLREIKRDAQRVNRSDNQIGKIFYGFFSTQFRATLILCDEKWGWISLILPPRRSIETLSMELSQSNNSLLNDCISHFNCIWEKCQINEITLN